MWIALVFDRKEQSGRGKQQHILFFRPRSLVKTLQGFLLLFVVVIPSWCGSFCFLFVFLGEDRETALGGEKIYTTIFFLFFFVLFHFLFLCCMFFFFFRQFLLKSKLVFFQGQKNGMGDAMIFCLDFLFSGYRFLPRFSALCWLPRRGCFSWFPQHQAPYNRMCIHAYHCIDVLSRIILRIDK